MYIRINIQINQEINICTNLLYSKPQIHLANYYFLISSMHYFVINAFLLCCKCLYNCVTSHHVMLKILCL